MKIFRILSALLTYPTPEFVAALDEIGAAIESERLLDADRRAALRALVDNMRGRDLYDLQESYGLLFDRTRSLSLHLFEHVHMAKAAIAARRWSICSRSTKPRA
jgi:nitrate reductase delta subunit